MEKYSVALCTYNGERYIAEQLESILNQSIPPDEIIISDDGSKDRTLEIVAGIINTRKVNCKILKNPGPHGVTNNFLYAISVCENDCIFTSDQDDVWVNKKAETMLQIFSENERALLVFSNGELVDQDLKPLNCSMWESVGITDEMLNKQNWFLYLLNRCIVTGAAMAFKKELLMPDEEIPPCWLHDGWLAWKAAVREGLIPCAEQLILYRQHGNNVVGMSGKSVTKKIKGYISGFLQNPAIHQERYNRYSAVMDCLGNELSILQKKELQECITFWKDLSLNDSNPLKLNAIKCIWKHYRKGDYSRFYNGSRGVGRDLLCVFAEKGREM